MLQKLLTGLAAAGFKACLLAVAILGAAAIVFGNPDNLKQALSSSGIYDFAISSVMESLGDAGDTGTGDNPLNHPAVRSAAEESFSPDLLQDSTEEIVDGIHAWLRGETDQPEFRVDLTDAKQEFAERVGDYAADRFSSLPLCTTQQLRSLQTADDYLSASCRIPGMTASQVRAEVESQILNSQDFLPEAEITSDDLLVNDEGESVTDQLNAAPAAYSAWQTAPWILGVLALFCAAILVLVSQPRWWKGLQRIGTLLLTTAALVAIIMGLLSFLFAQAQPDAIGATAQEQARAAAIDVAVSFSGAITRWSLIFAGIYAVLGLAMVLFVRFKQPAPEAITSEPTAPNSSAEPDKPDQSEPVKEETLSSDKNDK